MTEYRIQRIYEHATDSDGWRVLVDRIWPRGISKVRAQLDEWAKDLAPSDNLRDWFNHQAERFDEFSLRYRAELDDSQNAGDLADSFRAHEVVTLLYGAHDTEHNQAVVLRDWLAKR